MTRQAVPAGDARPAAVALDDSTEARLVDAALACVARVGVAKTTLDDVARTAGCSRATVYRYFPGKQPLLAAAVDREAARLGASLVGAAETADDVEDALVAMVLAAAEWLGRHDALRTVLEVEPHALLPQLAFDRCSALLTRAGQITAIALEHLVVEADAAARQGEWLARIVLSYVFSPSPSVVLTDEQSVRALVHDFVLPGLAPFVRTRGLAR
jgi:AcrR family transcriptional regulator